MDVETGSATPTSFSKTVRYPNEMKTMRAQLVEAMQAHQKEVAGESGRQEGAQSYLAAAQTGSTDKLPVTRHQQRPTIQLLAHSSVVPTPSDSLPSAPHSLAITTSDGEEAVVGVTGHKGDDSPFVRFRPTPTFVDVV